MRRRTLLPRGASGPVTPSGKPNAPPRVTPTAGDASATVNWSTADANGALPILEYEIKASSGLTVYAQGSENEIVVRPLNNHQSYTFTVAARNSNGWGPHSDPSIEVTPIGDVTGTATAFTKNFIEDPAPLNIDVVSLRNQLAWDWDGICTREQNVSDAREDHFQQTGWRLDSFAVERSQSCDGTVITSTGAWHNDPFCPTDTTYADLQNTLTGNADGTYTHTWTDDVRGGCSFLLTPDHSDGYISGPSEIPSSSPQADVASEPAGTSAPMAATELGEGWVVVSNADPLLHPAITRIAGTRTASGCRFSGSSTGRPGDSIKVARYVAVNLSSCQADVERGIPGPELTARILEGVAP